MNENFLQRAHEMQRLSEETEQNLVFVNQQLRELEIFRAQLEALNEKGAKGQRMLASLGKGVYLSAQRKNDDKLFVDVGCGHIIKKTISETQSVIDGQIKKFHEARAQLSEQLEQYGEAFHEMLEELESLKDRNKL